MRSFLLTGLRRLKIHKSRAINNMFNGSRRRNTANRTTERPIRANIIAKIGTIPADEALQHWLIRLKMLEVSLRNCASHRRRGALFHKMATKAMRKCQSFALSAYDKADNAKYGFPQGGINKKYTFFQWILQNLGCNKWCKKAAYGLNWRAQGA